MADVVVMPGIERRDLTEPELKTSEVLLAAIADGVTDVIVDGRNRAGGLYLSAANPDDVDRAVGALMHAVTYLSTDLPVDKPA